MNIFNNYSSSPNGLWAIDSEAMRARARPLQLPGFLSTSNRISILASSFSSDETLKIGGNYYF